MKTYPNLSGLFLMGRMRFLETGEYIKIATTSKVLLRITNMATGVTVDLGEQTVANVVKDTLQTGQGWGKSVGWNLGLTLPASARPAGGIGTPIIYVAEALVFPLAGQPVAKEWEIPTLALKGYDASVLDG